MRLLVLGGSWFVGSAIVDRACAGGHEVTVFNRGRTPATYPDTVRQIHGDREDAASLAALAGQGPWDAVIDVAGAVPAVVRDSARALAAVADRYVFVSTVSAYRDWPNEPVTETSPLHPDDPDTGSAPAGVPGPIAYGMLKAGCEAAIAREYDAGRRLILRPGVALGPGEYVGRVPWWLNRMRRGGRVLAPGRPDRGIQPVDVRDLAGFLVDLTAQGGSGEYNVAPPKDRETYGGSARRMRRMPSAPHPRSPGWTSSGWPTRGCGSGPNYPYGGSRRAPGPWTPPLPRRPGCPAGRCTRPCVTCGRGWPPAGPRCRTRAGQSTASTKPRRPPCSPPGTITWTTLPSDGDTQPPADNGWRSAQVDDDDVVAMNSSIPFARRPACSKLRNGRTAR